MYAWNSLYIILTQQEEDFVPHLFNFDHIFKKEEAAESTLPAILDQLQANIAAIQEGKPAPKPVQADESKELLVNQALLTRLEYHQASFITIYHK